MAVFSMLASAGRCRHVRTGIRGSAVSFYKVAISLLGLLVLSGLGKMMMVHSSVDASMTVAISSSRFADDEKRSELFEKGDVRHWLTPQAQTEALLYNIHQVEADGIAQEQFDASPEGKAVRKAQDITREAKDQADTAVAIAIGASLSK